MPVMFPKVESSSKYFAYSRAGLVYCFLHEFFCLYHLLNFISILFTVILSRVTLLVSARLPVFNGKSYPENLQLFSKLVLKLFTWPILEIFSVSFVHGVC